MKGILAALLLLTTGVAAQAESAMRIQFAEPVSMKATTGIVSFDAYGRRFELELEHNDRVTSKFSSQRRDELARYRILRGTLVGQAHSWVRLTEFNGRVEGAIWDGQDLYAVTSLDRIAPNLTTPIAGAPAQTVVFRLSDTINAFPSNFCTAAPRVPETTSNNGLEQYRAMVAELAARAASTPIPLQIEISLICDWNCQSRFAADTSGELLARHNIVDGVYAEQVGLLIIPGELRHGPAAPDPFTSTDPDTLLDALSTFRRNNSTVASFGLAHLMTGHTLDGPTVGISRIGGVCDIDNGVSLTEASEFSVIDGLIMAHELGHNFGAVHDGTGACASTPQTYLMSPFLSLSATFSQCSLDTMRPVIQAAQCITPADYGDVELSDAAPALSVENDVPLVVPYTVSSTGTQTARNASLEVIAPQDFTITGASGGNCSFTSAAATCVFGDIPVGEQRSASVTLLPAQIGQYTIDAKVSADNNPSTHNDSQAQPVNVEINADARITMSASPSTPLTDDPVDIFIVVASIRSHPVRGATVTFRNSRLTAGSANVNGGSCRVDPNEAVCTLDDIPGGSSRTITIHTVAAFVGLAQLSARVDTSLDADSSNNLVDFNLRVNPVRDVGVDEVTPNIVSLFGQPFEFNANVHSYGAQPIDDVTVNIYISTPQFADTGIESIAVGGMTCLPPPGRGYYQCILGTLAAGEVRPVTIRGHGASLGTYEITVQAYGTGDQDFDNYYLRRGVTIKNAVDVTIASPSPPTLIITEGLEGYGHVTAISNGSLAVPNAVLDVTAPDSTRFTRVFVQPEKGTCSIVNDRRLRCSLSFGANNATGAASVDFFLIGSTPGDFNLTATIQAPNDEVPGNDSVPFPVTISPLVNMGVLDFTGPQYLMVGSDTTITASVFTGSRPVPGATASLGVGSRAEFISLTTGAGTCTRTSPGIFQCDFGALPAGASVPLSAVVRGVQAGSESLFINASAVGDNNQSDNIRSTTFYVTDPGDLRVSISGSNPAPAGVAFPLTVTLRHTGSLVDGHVQITLPAGVVLKSISAGILICTGTSTLECDLTGWPEDQAFEIGLSVQVEVPSIYTVIAKVSSANDTDASNNEVSYAIENFVATPPPVTPPSNPRGGGGGGGGGGGSMDSLMLAALGLLLMFRLRAQSLGAQRWRWPLAAGDSRRLR